MDHRAKFGEQRTFNKGLFHFWKRVKMATSTFLSHNTDTKTTKMPKVQAKEITGDSTLLSLTLPAALLPVLKSMYPIAPRR